MIGTILKTMAKNKKSVHIIGIAGKLSAPLAKALKDLGWEVTGSDQPNVYPPVTDYLEKWQIPYTRGYYRENIKDNLDLVIVAGSAFHYQENNPEVQEAIRKKIPLISQAQAISRFVIKKNSIVVAGSFGKTTITAMLVSIFKEAGKKFSYMFGGMTKDELLPLQIVPSQWSIVEGDEYPTFGFDNRPKFWHYRPRWAILTACHWEHQDVYHSPRDYQAAFKKFLSLLPKEGKIFASFRGENVRKVVAQAEKETIFYSLYPEEGVEWWGEEKRFSSRGSSFTLIRKGKKVLSCSLRVLGEHNIENAIAAAALSLTLGISPSAVKKGLAKFRGLRRRLEIVTTVGGIKIIRDISQTKPRVQGALKALRLHFPHSSIKVIFYPHYSAFRYRSSLREFKGMFAGASEVAITRVVFKKGIAKSQRVLGKDIVQAAKLPSVRVNYLPLDEDVVEWAVKGIRKGDIIVLMSSGNYRGIDEKIVERLKKKK